SRRPLSPGPRAAAAAPAIPLPRDADAPRAAYESVAPHTRNALDFGWPFGEPMRSMDEGRPQCSRDRTVEPGEGSRLDSWKEIAAYLGRGITTVQRWEQKEGLPVHRLPHARSR